MNEKALQQGRHVRQQKLESEDRRVKTALSQIAKRR